MQHNDLESFQRDFENFKNAKVKCGIIGRSGTGKSSLINAIVGEEVSAVGEIETTTAISEPIEHLGLLFFDLPGSSTVNFPIDTYVDRMGITNFDCIILVTSERFYEDDLVLIDEIANQNIPLFTVRTKFDFSVERALRRGISEEETYNTIHNDLKSNLQGHKSQGIYLTSADFPAKYDLAQLINDISNSLDSIKKQRFIAVVNVLSESILAEKRKLTEKLISRYSAVAAANGLNPIPGLDVSLDIGLLHKMSLDIQNIYGLSGPQINYSATFLKENNAKLIVAKAVHFASKFVGRDAIIYLLKKAGLAVATKSASKWIPLVGAVIAAGIGYKLTSILGSDMLNEAEQIAFETFEGLKNS